MQRKIKLHCALCGKVVSNAFLPLEGRLLGEAKIICERCLSEYEETVAEIKQSFSSALSLLESLESKKFGKIKSRLEASKKLKTQFDNITSERGKAP